MKTIQPGKKKERVKQIWEGIKFRCEKCNGEFELEEGDAVLIVSQERKPGGKIIIHTPPCPTADCLYINTVEFYR